jgi:hypothetical protein
MSAGQNANKTKFAYVTLVFDDYNRFSGHKGLNYKTNNVGFVIYILENFDLGENNEDIHNIIQYYT